MPSRRSRPQQKPRSAHRLRERLDRLIRVGQIPKRNIVTIRCIGADIITVISWHAKKLPWP
ncbi:hypothetical protein AJ88_19320 [Mesorhizobium amorphae CCBAU 01583]|nr:hypothetical protein AJ88_19320 [Mesorhizobium amorphae CCBAU 01583]